MAARESPSIVLTSARSLNTFGNRAFGGLEDGTDQTPSMMRWGNDIFEALAILLV